MPSEQIYTRFIFCLVMALKVFQGWFLIANKCGSSSAFIYDVDKI